MLLIGSVIGFVTGVFDIATGEAGECHKNDDGQDHDAGGTALLVLLLHGLFLSSF